MAPRTTMNRHTSASSPPPIYAERRLLTTSTKSISFSDGDLKQDIKTGEQSSDNESSCSSFEGSDENRDLSDEESEDETDNVDGDEATDNEDCNKNDASPPHYTPNSECTISAEKVLAEGYAALSIAPRAELPTQQKPKKSLVSNLKKLAPNQAIVEDAVKAAYKGFEEGKKACVVLNSKGQSKGMKMRRTGRTELALKIGKATIAGAKEGKKAFDENQAKRSMDTKKAEMGAGLAYRSRN